MKSTLINLLLLAQVSGFGLGPAMAVEAPASISNKEAINKESQSAETGLEEARKKVLSDRPYKHYRYQKAAGIKLAISPVLLDTESTPDWWSEKQGFDLSKLLELAFTYYPGVSVIPGQTWEQYSVQKEIGSSTNPLNPMSPSVPSGRKDTAKVLALKPVITNYQYQVFKPKKRGVGLIFIAITSKSCKTESFITLKTELNSEQSTGHTSEASLGQIFGNSFDVSRLLVSESGGTSLNVNAIVAGAGGGDFKPPERVTKELLYESIADVAEGAYCNLVGNKECIDYYNKRQQPKPTPPKRDKYGKIIRPKANELKC